MNIKQALSVLPSLSGRTQFGLVWAFRVNPNPLTRGFKWRRLFSFFLGETSSPSLAAGVNPPTRACNGEQPVSKINGAQALSLIVSIFPSFPVRARPILSGTSSWSLVAPSGSAWATSTLKSPASLIASYRCSDYIYIYIYIYVYK